MFAIDQLPLEIKEYIWGLYLANEEHCGVRLKALLGVSKGWRDAIGQMFCRRHHSIRPRIEFKGHCAYCASQQTSCPHRLDDRLCSSILDQLKAEKNGQVHLLTDVLKIQPETLVYGDYLTVSSCMLDYITFQQPLPINYCEKCGESQLETLRKLGVFRDRNADTHRKKVCLLTRDPSLNLGNKILPAIKAIYGPDAPVHLTLQAWLIEPFGQLYSGQCLSIQSLVIEGSIRNADEIDEKSLKTLSKVNLNRFFRIFPHLKDVSVDSIEIATNDVLEALDNHCHSVVKLTVGNEAPYSSHPDDLHRGEPDWHITFRPTNLNHITIEFENYCAPYAWFRTFINGVLQQDGDCFCAVCCNECAWRAL